MRGGRGKRGRKGEASSGVYQRLVSAKNGEAVADDTTVRPHPTVRLYFMALDGWTHRAERLSRERNSTHSKANNVTKTR